jgi:hypothetical protein
MLRVAFGNFQDIILNLQCGSHGIIIASAHQVSILGSEVPPPIRDHPSHPFFFDFFDH